MAYNYEYPYTDAQRYNDDWLINKVKELATDWLTTSGEWTQTQEAWEELRSYITDYFNNLDVQEEINEKLEAMKADGSLFNIIKPLFDEYQQAIDVLSARMDTFTALGDGATTGDAELADIRVDYTGHTWQTAGDAVRGVTSELSSEIAEVKESFALSYSHRNMITDIGYTEDFYVSYQTGTLEVNADFCASDYIPLDAVKKIGLSHGLEQFAFYDNDKNYLSGVAVANGNHAYTEYDIPVNAKYARISIRSNSLNTAYIGLNNGIDCPIDIITVLPYVYRTADFASLRSAIDYAIQFKNAKVFVKYGNYNLLQEFATEISNSQATQYGICLENGVHILFESGITVRALYSGTDENVLTYFSPFYAGAKGGGFTLENLVIDVSNVRYCVHDELGGLEVPTDNKFINCRMTMDNTTATRNWYYQCIGGGCAKNSYVEIRNCYFKTKIAETTDGYASVSYHNADHDNAQSNIVISNCYFADKSTVRVSHYGNSPKKSLLTLDNCSLGSAPIVRHEVSGATTPENFELFGYLNEIRV